jgi:hypothetical protein
LSEFLLARGVSVPNFAGIHECYAIRQHEYPSRGSTSIFTANVSAENLGNLINRFVSQLDEPCFLIIETPTNLKIEQEIREAEADSFHLDVYYWGELTRKRLLEIFSKYEELLINDGMVRFGFRSHITRDELFIDKYKVVSILTADEQRYIKLIGEMGIPQQENIKTVWDTFSSETPRDAYRISVDGKDIYQVVEELKECGLFFAERREDQ